MKHLAMAALAVLITAIPVAAKTETGNTGSINVNYPNNRYPLVTKPYMELPIGTIRPSGWLQEQLQRMSDGMTGNLDQVYEIVMGPRNGWLGGDGDVWERGPG